MNTRLKGLRLALVAGLISMTAFGSIQPAAAGVFDDIGHAAGSVGRDIGRTVGNVGRTVGNVGKDIGRTVGNIGKSRPQPPEPMGSVTYVDHGPKKAEQKVAARRCPSGLVWRERFDGDTVCVLPGERDENRRKRGLKTGPASVCPSGLVWRERFDGDTVCVTPLERDENRRRRGLD